MIWHIDGWLFGALLITYANELYGWKVIEVAALVLLQALVAMHWQDARYATVANLIIETGLILI